MAENPLRRFMIRLRSFMQADLLTETARIRDDLAALHAEWQRLEAEQAQLRDAMERLHAGHNALRATLDRVEALDATARAVEDGLLSLTLLHPDSSGTPGAP